MLKNYLKTAWRNLINTKFYSALNIVGLTIGLAVGMLILIWVQDELSYDRFHAKADSIYKVNASIGTGASKQVWGGVPPPVAAFGLKEVPGIVAAVRLVTSYDYSVFRYKDKLLKEEFGKLQFVDDAFFTLFDYKLLKGNVKTPFPNDQSVVITESTAKKYFGNEDPIGKTIMGDSKDPYTVSGVLADFSTNSSINADMLFSMNVKRKQYDGKGMWKTMDGDWGDYYTTTFLQLRPDVSTKAIADKLTEIHMKNQTGIKPTDGVFQLQSLKDIHLYNPDGSSAGMQIVKVFSIVAVLILLIAGKPLVIKNLIDLVIAKSNIMFVISVLPYFYHRIALIKNLGSLFQFRKIYPHSRYNGHGYIGVKIKRVKSYAIGTVGLTVIAVIAKLISNNQKNHKASRHSQRKPKNIQESVTQVTTDIPESNNYITL
jgi:putative ABC transport system permease protein